MTKVIPEYGIDKPLECLFWERGANDTYQLLCANTRYFLRVYRCGAFPREANEFEVDVLNYLHQQNFPVAYPVARKSGDYLTRINAPEGARYVLLTTFAKGTVPDYESLENCRLVGKSVAQLHLASSGFESSRKRTNLDLQGLLDKSMTVIRTYMAHRPDALSMIVQVAQKVRAAVQAAPVRSLDIGICHGDLHGGNLHLHEGNVTHFDFEECAFGYRIYDLATFKWGTCMGSDKRRCMRWPAFLEGYESIRPISQAGHSLVNKFVIIRELAETAYGIRHVQDFGRNDIMAADIDHVCERLKNMIKTDEQIL